MLSPWPYRMKLKSVALRSGAVATETTSLCGETPGVLEKATELCSPEGITLKLSLSEDLPCELLRRLEVCRHSPPHSPFQDGRVDGPTSFCPQHSRTYMLAQALPRAIGTVCDSYSKAS